MQRPELIVLGLVAAERLLYAKRELKTSSFTRAGIAPRVALCIILGALGSWCTACEEKPEVIPPADAGPPVTGGAAIDAPLPPSKPVFCGTEECAPPSGSELLGPRACCVESSGSCGFRPGSLDGECASGTRPGNVDLHCPDVAIAGGGSLQGCCAPGGRCGAFDRFGTMGCVTPKAPQADAGDAGPECTPAPADCRSVTAMRCDGAEDCAANEVCCGRSQRGLYDRFECAESCDALSDKESGLWFEICQPGAHCRNPGYQCSGSEGLPKASSRLGRCSAEVTTSDGGTACDGGATCDGGTARDGGATAAGRGVTCGSATCAATEQCCVPVPGAPYCAPASDECRCGGPREASSAP